MALKLDVYLSHLASLCTEISLAAGVAVINRTTNYKFTRNQRHTSLAHAWLDIT